MQRTKSLKLLTEASLVTLTLSLFRKFRSTLQSCLKSGEDSVEYPWCESKQDINKNVVCNRCEVFRPIGHGPGLLKSCIIPMSRSRNQARARSLILDTCVCKFVFFILVPGIGALSARQDCSHPHLSPVKAALEMLFHCVCIWWRLRVAMCVYMGELCFCTVVRSRLKILWQVPYWDPFCSH